MCSSRSGRSVVWSASTCFHVLRSTWPSPFSNASIFSCWSAVSERLLRWKFVKSTSMRRHTFNFPSSKIYLWRRGDRDGARDSARLRVTRRREQSARARARAPAYRSASSSVSQSVPFFLSFGSLASCTRERRAGFSGRRRRARARRGARARTASEIWWTLPMRPAMLFHCSDSTCAGPRPRLSGTNTTASAPTPRDPRPESLDAARGAPSRSPGGC